MPDDVAKTLRPVSGIRIMLCLLVALTGGCAGTPVIQPEEVAPAVIPPATQTMLDAEIRTWLGTPHRMGGLTRRGVDCSGLVVAVYDRLFHMHLPRTTVSQMRTGRRVTPVNLAPGDLVFFKPRYKIHHVGIYMGDGRFAHASSSRGVIISRLDDDFWGQCYLTGRRVLETPQ